MGDLFDAWLGDDDDSPYNAPLIDGLHTLTASGVPIYLLHGNRDFLLGAGFETASGCRLLPDPCIIDLYGQPTLISHGDLLCTRDVDYQRVRMQLRAPAFQQAFLGQPLARRAELAQQYRLESREKTRAKSEDIMDVEQGSVEALMRDYGVVRLIHGHTHRPGVHDFILEGQPAQRIVLGDWFDQGSVLHCSDNDCRLAVY